MKLIPCLMMILATLTSLAQSKQVDEHITVNGIVRDFTTYIPAAKPGDEMPVVISLHGGFASPKGQFHLADFRPLADRDKFIVVCPASKHGWQDGKNVKEIDDVKFTSQLMDYLIKTYHADANRIYVTGISKGGFMAARLACQLNSRIAAVAIVSATLDADEGYAPEYPLPIMYIHGTKDHVVSYNGGALFGRKIYSHNDIIKKWVGMDGCDPKPIITNTPDTAKDGTSIIKEEYINHKSGLKVVGYTVNGGGHTWPGGWQFLPVFLVGKTTKNLNACDAIWAFFKPYKLRGEQTARRNISSK